MTVRFWDLAALICLSLLVAGADGSGDDELPQPENLTLSWNLVSFSLTAHWSEPTGLDPDCKVNYTVEIHLEKCPPSSTETCVHRGRTTALNVTRDISNEREICVIVITNPMECNNKRPSKPVYKRIAPPLALVKNFSCVYYSHEKMNCTWSLISSTSDLQLLYRNENKTLKTCLSYLTNGHMKIGCHLDDINLTTEYKFLIVSGTMEGIIPSVFMIDPKDSVKPETPKLDIIKENHKLQLRMSTPNFACRCWRYKFIYHKCNEKEEEQELDVQVLHLELDEACEYSAKGQVIFTSNCGHQRESEESKPVTYGKNVNLNIMSHVAMIVTPVVMSCCLIGALVLFRRHKNIILPKIPEPVLLFKEMFNSNNEGQLKLQTQRLYEPITEVVERDVRLEPESTS